jgi:hypothetical protein
VVRRPWLHRLQALLCALLLTACASDSSVRGEDATGGKALAVNPKASAEELYFDLVRLHSNGLLSPQRFGFVQGALEEIDEREPDEGERLRLYRVALSGFLQRALEELSQGENAGLVAAELQGRGYGRALHRRGVEEAERYAEYTVLVAGMLGAPTSEEEMVLMAAVPVGGYIVVRVAGVAFRKVPLLLHRLHSVDDVVDNARRLGLKPRYIGTREEMRQFAGEAVTRVADAPPHVGGMGSAAKGKENKWNPSNRKDNCTAGVACVIYNSLQGYFKHDADEMERFFGHTGRDRRFSVQDSLAYIENATGLRTRAKPVSMLGPQASPGHYAVFTDWQDGAYRHVVYGRVTPTGRVVIFDPQNGRRMSDDQMRRAYGVKAAPYLLEAP